MSDTTISPENTEEAPNERRALLRKLAIGGAGAAAGAVLLNHGTASAAAAPAALNLGTATTNTRATPTTLVDDPARAPTAGPSSLSVGGDGPDATSHRLPSRGRRLRRNADVPNGIHGSTTAPAGFGVVAANLATQRPLQQPIQSPTAQAIASPQRRPHVRSSPAQ